MNCLFSFVSTNFLSVAGLRLMGIGRNQYIDLMNQYRSKVHTPVHVHACTCTGVHNLSVINVHVQ